ncbi:hypothetical protein [Alteromonas australica]|uniref:hypothetical protein n=1 Tax=Alteromonas australica TaxID=589873 RepID=UPI0023567ED3|nr:hypothetical protein [Alteromonas australica]
MGYESLVQWRIKEMPREKERAFKIFDAGHVQAHLIGEERIGFFDFHSAVALSECSTVDILNKVIESLGGLKKASKCTPKRIRDITKSLYPVLYRRREIEEVEKAEYLRIRKGRQIRMMFDELSLPEQYEFFHERWTKFVEGEIPEALRAYVRIIELAIGQANMFHRVVMQGVNEANDPTLYLFRDINTEIEFEDFEDDPDFDPYTERTDFNNDLEDD